MKSVANDSLVRSQTFLSSNFLKFVAEQRAAQSDEHDVFVEAVTWRIASNAQGLAGPSQARCTVLMWQEFLGGWFPISWSSAYCEEILAQWQRLKQSGGAFGGHSAGGTSSLPSAQSFGCYWRRLLLLVGNGFLHSCGGRRRGSFSDACTAVTAERI